MCAGICEHYVTDTGVLASVSICKCLINYAVVVNIDSLARIVVHLNILSAIVSFRSADANLGDQQFGSLVGIHSHLNVIKLNMATGGNIPLQQMSHNLAGVLLPIRLCGRAGIKEHRQGTVNIPFNA